MMRKAIATFVIAALAGCEGIDAGDDSAVGFSNIKPDETIVFFPTSGWLDESSQEWHLPIHGWVYEPENSTVRIAAFEKILEEKYDLAVTEQSKANFARRVNLLLSDNERGKQVVVNIAGSQFELPESAENGHFEQTMTISVGQVAAHAEDGVLRYKAATRGAAAREFNGVVKLLDPDGLSVISDIDDTVKISNVTDRKSLLEHTFLLDFIAAPGMTELYQDWATEAMGFHFVSSSPWHLYEPLDEFLDSNSFPQATFSLKSVRFRDETLFDLFKEGTETKPAAIKKILDRYPKRQFVLVGDSGEQDPEVYAAMLRERPDQILKIYIRNVTGESAGNGRFNAVFGEIDPDRWQLFDDPRSLRLPAAATIE